VSSSRSFIEWTTGDYEGVLDLARRMSNYVESNEPDTLVFEWFGDEESGRVAWYQVYRNDEAFLEHAQNMAEAGFREEAGRLLSFDRLVVLSPITHPQVKEMAQELGGFELRDIAGVIR
jgi:quinol monooxygenase YgiN